MDEANFCGSPHEKKTVASSDGSGEVMLQSDDGRGIEDQGGGGERVKESKVS